MRRCAVAAWLGPFCVAGISHCRVSGLDLPEYGVYARFHHAVEGTATQVDRHHANFENPLPFRFCNWRIDYEYRDLNNVAYQTCEGKTHTHCHITGGRDRYDQKLPGPGKACATLWVNGTRWRTHYHAILSS
jgi:hypothetical protein